jgi:hypothetical protein
VNNGVLSGEWGRANGEISRAGRRAASAASRIASVIGATAVGQEDNGRLSSLCGGRKANTGAPAYVHRFGTGRRRPLRCTRGPHHRHRTKPASAAGGSVSNDAVIVRKQLPLARTEARPWRRVEVPCKGFGVPCTGMHQ